MNNAPSPANDEPLAEVAAHWCMRMHAADCSEEERAQFILWLAEHPRHAAEYDAMLEIWELSEHLPSSATPSRPPLRQAPLPPVLPVRQRRRSWRPQARAIALTLLALPLAAYTGWMLGWLPNSYEHFETAHNISRITLGDGSEVELNSNSDISFSNYRDQRSVSLNTGEAYFHVSHDSAHPFVVSAGDGSITVTGTRFNVWKYQDNVVVTVTEGSVRVQSERQGNDSTLTPNMQASFKSGDLKPKVVSVDTQTALAWREGKLILNNITLGEAVPMLNRYLDEPLLLADQNTADIRIGGIYSTRDIANLVKALPKVLPIRLEPQGDGTTLIRSHNARL
ncbi:transmembrane sensor [Pseudomonas sp. TE3786]